MSFECFAEFFNFENYRLAAGFWFSVLASLFSFVSDSFIFGTLAIILDESCSV